MPILRTLLFVLCTQWLFLPSSARAEEPANPGSLVAPDAPRFRFGLSSGATVGYAWHEADGGTSSAGGGLALVIDAGVQVNRNLAVFARLEGSSVLMMNQAAAYAVVEWTPSSRLSLGTGLGIDSQLWLLGGGAGGWAGVSVPLQISYNFRSEEQWLAGGRSGTWRLGVEGALGYGPCGSGSTCDGWGTHGSLLVGYQWM